LPTNFLNSVAVTAGTVILTTIAAVLAGFALVHLRTPGKAVIVALLVASLFFPTRVTALIAIWDIQRRLGLINVTWGLILPYAALSIAISVFIMRGAHRRRWPRSNVARDHVAPRQQRDRRRHHRQLRGGLGRVPPRRVADE
jgi:ABC-type glycerol-3-phosphate transport system permease component